MKVIQLNVERDLHVDTVLPFLREEAADVICLQEVLDRTAEHYALELGMQLTFAPHAILRDWEEGTDGCGWGVALLTKEPHTVLGMHQYQGESDSVPEFSIKDREDTRAICRSLVRVAPTIQVSDADTTYTISSVHFTYTKNGQPDVMQEQALERLLELLEPYPDLLLAGDFNIPRGNYVYDQLHDVFVDNIPLDTGSSLDPHLHRAGPLPYMVDYMWTRGSHQLTNVRKVCGVSDHCAFVGTLRVA
jgi:endonuclease/exonuclease/phosphatase family metal-dependent hydrolase